MGCCLAALISDFPSAAKYTTSKATSTFLVKITKRDDDGVFRKRRRRFLSYDNPGAASLDTSMTENDGNVLGFTRATATTDAPTQHCHTPPAKEANQYAKKREVVAISDLTPTRHSNRILVKMASAQNNVASQRIEAPISAALTGKRKLQSHGRKKLLLGKK
jgi:hypothetical protein